MQVSNLSPSPTFGLTHNRWSSAYWCHSFRRTSQRSLCQHWPTSRSQSCPGNLRTPPQPRLEIPSFKANGRPHPCYRQRDERYQLLDPSHPLPHSTDCSRNLDGVRYTRKFRLRPNRGWNDSGLNLCRQTYKFGWDFAAITAGALVLYTWFTVRTTSWRTQFRREANKADNKAASTAVDSLINFEAVKVRSRCYIIAC